MVMNSVISPKVRLCRRPRGGVTLSKLWLKEWAMVRLCRLLGCVARSRSKPRAKESNGRIVNDVHDWPRVRLCRPLGRGSVAHVVQLSRRKRRR